VSAPKKDAPETTPAVEWAVGALGGAALAVMIGVLVREGLAGVEGPPEITLTVETALPAPGGHLVPFVARNTGGSTATAVRVEGALRDRDAHVETSTVELDFLPQGGERRGGLFFTQDPAALSLTLRAEGFAEP
jgi:uncharacterized protein (TIGR02588 family)